MLKGYKIPSPRYSVDITIRLFIYLNLGTNYVYIFFEGKTGDWINHFSPHLNDQIDPWIEKHLAEPDLKCVTQLIHQQDYIIEVSSVVR